MIKLANKGFVTATDLADYLVKNHDKSFRKAYQTTAAIVNYKYVSPTPIKPPPLQPRSKAPVSAEKKPLIT